MRCFRTKPGTNHQGQLDVNCRTNAKGTGKKACNKACQNTLTLPTAEAVGFLV